MPTLLEKNKIVAESWMKRETRKKIEDMKSIDFLIEYISDRISTGYDQEPKIKPKSIGSHVLVLRSGTGSGKSTVIPSALYNTFFEKIRKNIIITQTTIATTIDIPFQIVRYNENLVLGNNIGYQTGTISRKPIKGILFCTTGILLQFLKILTDEEFIAKYSFILIDEVHTRTIELDNTLFYLKMLLRRQWKNPNCPFVILMSGTFEPKIFMEYFDCPKENFIDVVGSTFPIKETFTKFNLTNYMEYVIDLIEKIHIENIKDIEEKNFFRDILVFMQGKSQMLELYDKVLYLNYSVFRKGLKYSLAHNEEIQKKYSKVGGKEKSIYYLAPIFIMSENIKKGEKEYRDLYSDIENVTVDIYEFNEKGEKTEKIIGTFPCSRRVIFATNVIETGLTIDSLKYCIDTGYVKEISFNPNFGCNVNVDKAVTKASSDQRKGRVGRKSPGFFYACYTKETYDKLQPLSFSEIVNKDITKFLLDLIISETKTEEVDVGYNAYVDNFKNEKISKQFIYKKNIMDPINYKLSFENAFKANTLDFIQYPSADSMMYSVEKLHALGFIDYEYLPTLIGYYGSKFQKIEIENIRMILAGYSHGANILDLITISVGLQIGSHKTGINSKKYTPRNVLGLSEKESQYYSQVVLCDEFIEYVFLWNEFMEVLDTVGDIYVSNIKKKKKNLIPFNYINNWCEKNKVSYDSMLLMIQLRDEIITNMLNIGLNPYYNGLGLTRGRYNLTEIFKRNAEEGIEEIRKPKKCIYDGYYLNVYTWNDNVKKYTSDKYNNAVELRSRLINRLPFIVSSSNNGENTTGSNNTSIIEQRSPKKIIVSKTVIREQFAMDGEFDFFGLEISVLDGYVEYDKHFT